MGQDKKRLTDKELQGALERALLMWGCEVRFETRESDSIIEWIREALSVYPRVLEELQAARDALQVTWIPCEERKPDTPRDVWVHPFEDVDDVGFAPIASWCIDEWWADHRPLETSGFTHWAEVRWPQPPAGE